MRKHRNFLVFYGLWTVAILSVLVAFETPTEKETAPATKSCVKAKSCVKELPSHAYEEKLCMLHPKK